jgi:hypothetical protein
VHDHATLISALVSGNMPDAKRALARNWERGLAWINPPATAEHELAEPRA